MMPSMIRVVTIWGLGMLAVGAALAEEPPDVLAKKLGEFKGAKGGQVIPITEDSLTRVFPGHRFYVLRFRQYPVSLVPPEPLKANNLFVVKPDGSVEHIADTTALERFFRATLAPVRTEIEAKAAAKAWLRLTQELRQDGFFQFSVPEGSLRIARAATGGRRVTGRAVVDPRGGNQGEIVASLTFDQAGKLANVSETATIKRGIRPICQATKLLDPDPIVRGMAEQAILVMGKAAKEYLAEQRAKAGPELRRAIDRIWGRILAGER